ncbi:hypothetical protein NE237_009166 [Protea cynaroides]|uniref:Uncharacterized protein n=1 Tax=Protea cynaroides TaxID=273540 RepID=A0A9Q0KX99_9MAGN|nr:hypothetical protein NE237_009166 [Protea cynaroides]
MSPSSGNPLVEEGRDPIVDERCAGVKGAATSVGNRIAGLRTFNPSRIMTASRFSSVRVPTVVDETIHDRNLNEIRSTVSAIIGESNHDRNPNSLKTRVSEPDIGAVVGDFNLNSRVLVDGHGDPLSVGVEYQSTRVSVGAQGAPHAVGIITQNPNPFVVGLSSSDPMLMEAGIRHNSMAVVLHQGPLMPAAQHENDLRRVAHKRLRWTWRERDKSTVSNGVGTSEGPAENIYATSGDCSNSITAELGVNINRASLIAAQSFADVARGFHDALVEGLAKPTSVAEDHGKEAATNVGVEKEGTDVPLQQVAIVEKDGVAGLPVQGRAISQNPYVPVDLGVKQSWANVYDWNVSEILNDEGTDSFHEEKVEDLNHSHLATPPGSDSRMLLQSSILLCMVQAVVESLEQL